MDIEQSIERCEQLIKPENANWIGISNQEAIRGLLDMLKEKDKEIEKLKKENEHWKNGFERELEDNRENTCELLKQDLIIRKQENQIDLMAENIFQEGIIWDDKEEVKQYFKSKAEKE